MKIAPTQVVNVSMLEPHKEASKEPHSQKSTSPKLSDDKDLKEWFGNSLVKDDKGEPLVVYHGTKADFDEFNIRHSKEGRVGKGFYFTASEEEAKSYAGENGRVIKAHLNIDSLSDMTKGGAGGERIGDGKKWGLKTKLTKGGGDVYFVKNPKQIRQIKG